MPKTYMINGVQVSYQTYQQEINSDPDDFGNLENIDAPDIPSAYIDAYSNDLRNERAGRGQVLWTPRRRMIDSIEYKEMKVAEKKHKRLEKRQEKLSIWGERRSLDEAYQCHVNARSNYYAQQQQNQDVDDIKSTKRMALIFGIFFLCMCLSVAILPKLQIP